MITLPGGLRVPLYLRYVAASGASLAVDVLCFLALIGGGMPAPLASAIGYGVGVLAHWLLSSRAVFGETLAEPGRARQRQQALFVTSAAIGLATTVAIVFAGEAVGLDARVAKLVAVATSFQLTFLLRRRIVFA